MKTSFLYTILFLLFSTNLALANDDLSVGSNKPWAMVSDLKIKIYLSQHGIDLTKIWDEEFFFQISGKEEKEIDSAQGDRQKLTPQLKEKIRHLLQNARARVEQAVDGISDDYPFLQALPQQVHINPNEDRNIIKNGILGYFNFRPFLARLDAGDRFLLTVPTLTFELWFDQASSLISTHSFESISQSSPQFAQFDKDRFVTPIKEGFIDRHRNIFGFCAGALCVSANAIDTFAKLDEVVHKDTLKTQCPIALRK